MRLSRLAAVVLGMSLAGACATGVVTDPGLASGVGGDDGTGTGNPVSGSTSVSGSGASSSSGAASSSTGAPGPCVMAADCVALSDLCNVGTCINGVCEKTPSSEGTSCDDGLFCTENDACQAGTCVGGTTKFCPSPDSCHLGACDEGMKSCGSAPGNDGASCDDGDPCTFSGICSAGVCSKGPAVDCSAFDGECAKGICDPTFGCQSMPLNDGALCNDMMASPCSQGTCKAAKCVAGPANDGTLCDDLKFCTVNDKCAAGKCGGVPNTCAAPGDVCMIGTCDENAKSCVAVPGNDGKACDDKNGCTVGEKCSAGVCVGGAPGNPGLACDDGDGCTSGTTCTNGVCGNPASQITQCMDGDMCCPAACSNGMDTDCLVCHALFGPPGVGYMCPTNATTFCVPPPLDPTSPAQAKAACEACYGVPCFEENADCAGPGFGPHPPGQYIGGEAYFGYTSGCSGDEGRAWAISSSFTTYGYWGK